MSVGTKGKGLPYFYATTKPIKGAHNPTSETEESSKHTFQ